MNDQPTPRGASGEGPQALRPSPLQDSIASAAARIQTIVEAAEEAAAGIIDDAEAQARRYLEESRLRGDRIADRRAQEMSSLADALVDRAEAVKRQSDELLRALDQAKLQVEGKLQPEAAEQAPVHHLKPVDPSPGAIPPSPPAPRFAGAPPSDGARLLATQMAVAGSSRIEIESRLQNEFGIDDAGPMLDAILGRGD
jgi:hypothetical protein